MKVKQNLSLTNNFLYVDGRFYYGIAPSRQYPCKGCTERKVGCHAYCERYLKAKKDHDHDVKEELKHSNPGFSKERERKLRKKERKRQEEKIMYPKVAVYAGTRNLYEQMYVCVKSLMANTIMDKVYLLIEDYEFPYRLPDNVYIANVSEQEFFLPGSPNYSSPWSYMAMLRCVLSIILKNESRVLWLDCDTIVNEDISDLFQINMEGCYYAGVVEPQKSRDIFRYINSGVLLCNLDLLRDTKKEVELAYFLNHYKMNWADQEVINLLCQGHIRTIDSSYNQNAFTVPCIRPRIIHYAADKSFKDSWAYKKYADLEMFAYPEEEIDE